MPKVVDQDRYPHSGTLDRDGGSNVEQTLIDSFFSHAPRTLQKFYQIEIRS